jgi:hypothetical protein
MKVHASYNSFDSVELLEGSILQIRPYVDTVSVVFQEISHYGHPAPRGCMEEAQRLVKEGLVDVLHVFEPPGVDENSHSVRHGLEAEKRQLGLNIAKEYGATHFISLDDDEFYEPSLFSDILNRIELRKWDTTSCYIQTYSANPNFLMRGLAPFFVPFIHEIKNTTQAKAHIPYFCYADPTRAVSGATNPKLLNPEFIKMHHYTNCRVAPESKFKSHNANINFRTEHGENYIVEKVRHLEAERRMTITNYDSELYLPCDDMFGINDLLRRFKERWSITS